MLVPSNLRHDKTFFLVHHVFRLDLDATYARTQAGPILVNSETPNPAKDREIQDFLAMIERWPDEKLDIFATLFAAWNDLIIWEMPTTDEAILHEALDNWHPDRQLISKPTWAKMLHWMHEVGFEPTGFGNPTKQIEQPRLSLE